MYRQAIYTNLKNVSSDCLKLIHYRLKIPLYLRYNVYNGTDYYSEGWHLSINCSMEYIPFPADPILAEYFHKKIPRFQDIRKTVQEADSHLLQRVSHARERVKLANQNQQLRKHAATETTGTHMAERLVAARQKANEADGSERRDTSRLQLLWVKLARQWPSWHRLSRQQQGRLPLMHSQLLWR